MNVPEDLDYTVEHEWIKRVADGRVRVGITDYAQDQLGDVVYVELPDNGKVVAHGDLIAEIESTKSVGEVYAPLAGTISAVNTTVADSPELVNSSPYVDGWLIEIEYEGDLDTDAFLDAEAYRNLVQ